MKAVIFDLDGTLADTLESIAYCTNRALAVVGYEAIAKERYKLLVGDGADELIRRALREVGDTEGRDYETVREAYREIFAKDCMYQVAPYEGIKEMLLALKQADVCLVVLSNKPDTEAKQVVADLFGENIFSLVAGQKAGVARKPSPEGIYGILEELQLSKEDVYYVGDTATDMQTGKSADLYTIGVLWGFREKEELIEHQADALIERPEDLLSYLNKPEIKLVVTDVDGTLVKDSSPEVYREMIEAMHQLVQSGIKVVVASGREYASIRKMFAEVADEIYFIANNGAEILYQEERLSLTPIDPQVAIMILEDMRKYQGRCELLTGTPEGCLTESTNQEFIDLIRYGYRNPYCVVDDLCKENVDILKIALYRKEGITEIGEGEIIPRWKETVKACMSGKSWVDMMNPAVDKGNALRFLQEMLGISKAETMAFGDNFNDVGMLRQAGESYAVVGAVPEAIVASKYKCPGYEEKGVYQILKKCCLIS